MEEDIVLVMIGLMPVKDFLGALEKIDLPQKDSNAKMIQEIEDKIFSKIRQAVLKKLPALKPWNHTKVLWNPKLKVINPSIITKMPKAYLKIITILNLETKSWE